MCGRGGSTQHTAHTVLRSAAHTALHSSTHCQHSTLPKHKEHDRRGTAQHSTAHSTLGFKDAQRAEAKPKDEAQAAAEAAAEAEAEAQMKAVAQPKAHRLQLRQPARRQHVWARRQHTAHSTHSTAKRSTHSASQLNTLSAQHTAQAQGARQEGHRSTQHSSQHTRIQGCTAG